MLGTPEQVELATWLIEQLDVRSGRSGVHEYITGDAVARVFYLTNLTKPQSLQELITTLRQAARIDKLSLQESGTLALRGTAEQAALAAWLVMQLDVPGVQVDNRQYPGSIANGDVSRIFYLTNATGPLAINEAITALRRIAGIYKLFALQEKNAIALQATPVDAKLAEWLIRGLDRPAAGGTTITYVIPGDRDDQVRIFYGSKTFAAHIDTLISGPFRSYLCNSAQALIVRGTSEQLATYK